MKDSKLMIWFLAILIISVIACAPSQPAIPEQAAEKAMQKEASSGNIAAVSINGFKFVPADVTVNAGDTVVWTNQDNVPHTVESSDGTLKSDELSKGDTYKHAFTKPGKYEYKCGIHPSMHGSVTVR